MQKKVHLIAGARPNFMKIAPLWRELIQTKNIKVQWIHAGQHSSLAMSGTFLKEHKLPAPNHRIWARKGSHGRTTASILLGYEKILQQEKPDLVIVAGDVDATLACALAAKKLNIAVGHVEAGLRSGDRSMPEEINRILTDHLNDICWTTSPQSSRNLKQEGISKKRIQMVGNIMIDSLFFTLKKIKRKSENQKSIIHQTGLLTLHRPVNVDHKNSLSAILRAVMSIPKTVKIYFPMHPRTGKKIRLVPSPENKNLIVMKPQTHSNFIKMLANARFVITDSGGVQEEAALLGVPCGILRQATERPEALSKNMSYLIKPSGIRKFAIQSISTNRRAKKIRYWDGNTAKRIAQGVQKILGRKRI